MECGVCFMRLDISNEELSQRIDLNFTRLCGDYYGISQVFSPPDYAWYGDKEGRALLAFVCHYRIGGREIPCMKQMMSELDGHLNADGYFGPIYENLIDEQQFSGHSWLLRGLCEYYEAFHDKKCLDMITRIAQNLYVRHSDMLSSYPVNRTCENVGDVSGSRTGTVSNWILSSDVGCAFMSIDGLSHAYRVTKNPDIKRTVDIMISCFMSIDKVAIGAQTHCTLTAARGMLRMFHETGDGEYLDKAESILDLYAFGGGMTATYENLNWWGRTDSWTEPCAVVDSLMLSCELFKAVGNAKYRTLAARIYHNGFSSIQRPNGGAGTDSVVLAGTENYLYTKMYEAYFCCTMRLAEGLRYVSENRELLYAELDGKVTKHGQIYRDGDLIYSELSDNAKPFAQHTVQTDNRALSPLLKLYRLPEEIVPNVKQKVIF